jgi:hypothetical protein
VTSHAFDAIHAVMLKQMSYMSGNQDSYIKHMEPLLAPLCAVYTAGMQPMQEFKKVYEWSTLIAKGIRGTPVMASNMEICPVIPLMSCVDNIFAFMPDEEEPDIRISEIVRSDVLATSYVPVMSLLPEQWAMCDTMSVNFHGESGYGEGVAREWLGLLAEEMFTSKYFTQCVNRPGTYHPVATTEDADIHHMEFAGRIIGMAIKLRINIPVKLSSAAVKMATMRQVDLYDLYEVDENIAKTCKHIVDSSTPADFNAMSLDYFVGTNGEELFRGSSKIPVTFENRVHYTSLVVSEYLHRVRGSCVAIIRGITDVIYGDRVKIALVAMARMTPEAFNDVFSATDVTIDVEELKMKTGITLIGSKSDMTHKNTSKAINTFFAMVRDMTPKERMALIRFWTGYHGLSSKGFDDMYMRLVLDMSAHAGRLPTAKTCSMVMTVSGTVTSAKYMKERFVMAMAANEMEDD